jgi:hypothetical protein
MSKRLELVDQERLIELLGQMSWYQFLELYHSLTDSFRDGQEAWEKEEEGA